MEKEPSKKEEKQLDEPNVQINAQYVKDLSFEAPQMPFAIMAMKTPPKLDVSVDINAACVQKEEKRYTVELMVKLEAKNDEGKVAFLCELTYGALTTLNIPEENIQPFLLIEIPHLLFPYVRAIIANTTREAGIIPVTLSPIDFASLYRARMAKEATKKN